MSEHRLQIALISPKGPLYRHRGGIWKKSLRYQTLQQHCLAARREFYSWRSIARRGFAPVNRSDGFMWRNFYLINAMHRADVSLRDHYPLGDDSWKGPFLTAN